MSWRTLRILIEGLPPQSRTMTELRKANPAPNEGDVDPEAGRWSNAEMLLAAAVDELRLASYYLLKVNGAKKLKRPPQVPRPGVKVPGKARKINAAGADLLLSLINGKGG